MTSNDEKITDKVKHKIEEVAQHPAVKEALTYAKDHQSDTAAYAILLIGIALSFFWPILGGTIVGAIVGIYFADEIIDFCQHMKGYIEKRGVLRSLVLAAAAIVLFVALPALFIAAAIVVGVKYWVYT